MHWKLRSLNWLNMTKTLRFHWSMSSVGEELKGSKARNQVSGVPDIDKHIEFCEHATSCGIEHVLTAFGFHRTDPIALAAALSMKTSKINFLVACRSGVASPTLFVQQINSVSAISNGRVCINMVAGHSPKEFRFYGDMLEPNKRYDRTDEFLTICNKFWNTQEPVNFAGDYYTVENGTLNTPFVSDSRSAPEIYLGGKSERAFELAAKHASCLLTLPDPPQEMRPKIEKLLKSGTDVGLLVSIITRETREEALEAAYSLIEPLGDSSLKAHKDFMKNSVSEAFNSVLHLGQNEKDWLCPYLWVGAVPYLGAPSISLVGSYEEVAQALMEYKDIGVTQFLFMGWPDKEEMSHFASGILPRVREMETSNVESIRTLN